MANPYKQERRQGKLNTPLGEDALVLRRFDGVEAMSELFEYRVEAASHGKEPDLDRLLGRNCTVSIKAPKGETRYFDGILTEAQLIGIEDKDFIYRMVLRPWLWMLSKRSNCLIFHELTAPEIIARIFDEHSGFAEYRQVLNESYPVKEYCVQYRESDLAFVCRLMEENGIGYHFVHEEGKHTLVMGDGVSAYDSVPRESRRYVPSQSGHWRDDEHFNVWRPARSFTSGKVTLEEYDFKKPTTELQTDKSQASDYENGELELFDYPGKYTEEGDGKKLARWWLESEQTTDQRYFASGDCVTCPPGYRVRLEDHHNEAHNKEYLILRAVHSYATQRYGSTTMRDNEGYHGTHEMMPSDRPYRPPQVTPEPRVYGPQTATVVGDGDIDCDEYGRVLLRFHWDRKSDQSMRVRVAQVWASQKWGGMFIPRVGMEVVVDHLEGDPDQPIVIGCVYNDDNMPPYDLPGEKNKAGWKSQSTPGGAGYNELVMDDTAGDELVRFHAQRNLESTIENNETRDVGFERKTTIGMTDTLDVGIQRSVTAGVQMSLTVGGSSIVMTPVSIAITSPTITLNGSAVVSVTAGASITMTTSGLFQTTAGAISTHTSGAPYMITAPIFKVTGLTILTGPPIISPV